MTRGQELRSAVGPPPNPDSFGHVLHEIKRQKAALKYTKPVHLWRLHFASQFPKIYDIALRLLQMGTQSGADVERACKAHKLVHTKVRNRLLDEHVKMLLYCYINQRLFKKNKKTKDGKYSFGSINGDGEDFLDQTILQHLQDELGDEETS